MCISKSLILFPPDPDTRRVSIDREEYSMIVLLIYSDYVKLVNRVEYIYSYIYSKYISVNK